MPGKPVGLGALVEVELDGDKSIYFLGPRAGGTEVVQDRKEILVITPQSPLGEQLMGKNRATARSSTSGAPGRPPAF